MTNEAQSDIPEKSSEGSARHLAGLETRLVQMEAQIRALQEGVAGLNQTNRAARQRGLYLRIGILIALLAAFFYMQYRKTVGG